MIFSQNDSENLTVLSFKKDVAIIETYKDLIDLASDFLTEGLLAKSENVASLIADGHFLDFAVQQLTKEVAKNTAAKMYQQLGNAQVVKYYNEGWRTHRNECVTFKTIFGDIKVSSPSMRKPGNPGVRPLKAHFGVIGNSCSESVTRVLSSFGSEKSFERAAQLFKEHYGWEVSADMVLRRTKEVADDAIDYLEETIDEKYLANQENSVNTATDPFILELDGCAIRTGKMTSASAAGRDDLAQEQKS